MLEQENIPIIQPLESPIPPPPPPPARPPARYKKILSRAPPTLQPEHELSQQNLIGNDHPVDRIHWLGCEISRGMD